MSRRKDQRDDGQIIMLRRAFSMFDSEKQGRIEKEKVRTILNTMVHNYDDLELDRMLDSEDAEACGKLNFDSFVRVAIHFLEEDDEKLQKELKEAFRLYDKEENATQFLKKKAKKISNDDAYYKNVKTIGRSGPLYNIYVVTSRKCHQTDIQGSFLGNGYIPTSSLREILAALDEQLTPDQLNEMIAEIDTDASGTVDFDEFMAMMTGD